MMPKFSHYSTPEIPIASLVVKSIILTVFIILWAAGKIAAAPEHVDFVRDVRPIFKEHCYSCHGEKKQKSGLRLDMRSGAFEGGEYHQPTISPGNSAASNLIRFIRGEDEEMRMPAEGDGLSAKEIETLTTWIDQGAVWPDGVDLVKPEDRADHWSFKPLADFNTERDIDFLIDEKLAAAGLERSPEADRRVWLRRVYFDLIGLPPTPEQVRTFIADTKEGEHARVVDELLRSHHYGERWAQHWLDVVRYADTHGFEVNTPRPNAWPYRDYVIDAFNNDTPFDQFIREQLAGDQLGKDAATGFLVTAARLLPGQIGKDAPSMRLARQDELGEIVINTSEAFLGLSVGCARCHNHKFDAISAKDYYSMQAFFAGVTYGDRPIQSAEANISRRQAEHLKSRVREIDRAMAELVPLANSDSKRPPVNALLNVERFAPERARKVRFTIHKTNLYEPCIDELEVFDTAGNNVALDAPGVIRSASGSNVEANRHQLEFINDGEFGNSRSWMCSESHGGWVMIEFPSEHTIDRIAWARDRNGKFTDRLAIEYTIEAANESGQWRIVADSTDRSKGEPRTQTDLTGLGPKQQAEAKALLEEKRMAQSQLAKLESAQTVFGGVFGKPEPMHLLNRGDAEQPKEEVAPAVLSALGDLTLEKDALESERRIALASWIADPENPLTARVAVNRIWQGHFGMGLVETSNDFGRIGAAPSHPELLDWLAAEFIRSGWSMKHMHRLIVLSDTYRQSGKINPKAMKKDADVRLLWRFPSRRLEGEIIRDTILAVSGQLNLKTGGPGFDLFKSRGGLSGFPPVDKFKDDGLRRMIYAHKIRMEPDAVFGAFDCPDAGQSVSRRRQSTTPLQALNLFNSQFTIDQANALAKRVELEFKQNTTAQIRRIYQLAYARQPEPIELADAQMIVREHGLQTLCRAMINSSEFLFIP
ncbi:MAG: mono/diheme cytochrome c family protein [Verrucomicrobiales bacterium]|jgi:mono/diheme cytochrome c family protein